MTEVLAGHEYTTLEGVGRFGRLLSVSSESAVYEFEGDGKPPATLIELRQGDTAEAENQLARWHGRIQFLHPNLLQLYEAGSATLQSAPVIYAVTERAEESLEEVLSTRPLIVEEVSEILRPALSALAYLHQNGYAHGRLEPSKVLAVGNTVKLSTEDVLRIDEGGNPEDDMWAFGTVLVQAITGSAPQLHSCFGPTEPPQLAVEPLNGVVRHCLDVNAETRWTAEQALSWVERAADAENRGSMRQVRPEPMGEPAAPAGRKWIYAVAVGLVLVAGIVWQTSKSSHPAAVVPVVTEMSEVVRPEPFGHPEAKPASQAPPEPVARSAAGEKFTPALRNHDRRSSSWVVVVASYGARGPAEKRVREASKKWPKFKVELVDAPSEKARLLVVIGKNLSETDAEALRERARRSNLPRDIYIKRIDTGDR